MGLGLWIQTKQKSVTLTWQVCFMIQIMLQCYWAQKSTWSQGYFVTMFTWLTLWTNHKWTNWPSGTWFVKRVEADKVVNSIKYEYELRPQCGTQFPNWLNCSCQHRESNSWLTGLLCCSVEGNHVGKLVYELAALCVSRLSLVASPDWTRSDF